MIQKFSQFINESTSEAQPQLSSHEEINNKYSAFITRAEDRLDMMKYKITEILAAMDNAIESVLEEFKDIIVGEPQIVVGYDLSDIEIRFNTTIPNNDEAWETDESPAQDLEYRLDSLFDDHRRKSVKININISYKPNDEGNCVIELNTYVIDKDVFGDLTDTFVKLGED